MTGSARLDIYRKGGDSLLGRYFYHVLHPLTVGEFMDQQPNPKFFEPAIKVKTLLWPALQNTQLAFVMEDAALALNQAKQAQTSSELKNALQSLVVALEPFMRDGATHHYREKKVVMFKEAGTGKRWLQMSPKPSNPYSDGKADLIKWPDVPAKLEDVKTIDKQKMESKSNPMSGHHHH